MNQNEVTFKNYKMENFQESKSSGIQKRNVALKISIKEIIDGLYIKDDDNSPNYINSTRGKLFRANIIGVVVSKELGLGFDTLAINDSTGTINIRSFENRDILKKINLGDVVLIIGRPREYNGEKYILPEIVKPLENNLWAILRKKELNIENIQPEIKISVETNKNNFSQNKVFEANNIKSNNEKQPNSINVNLQQKDSEKIENPIELILNFIKNNDTGSGVSFEDIILNSNIKNCEEFIQSLIEEGEIFEIRPGIIKVL